MLPRGHEIHESFPATITMIAVKVEEARANPGFRGTLMHSNRILSPTLLCALLALAPASLQAAQPGQPAKVAMVAGNGQVVQPNFPATTPMTILVTDAAGIPVAGVPVSWSSSCAPSDYACSSSETGTLLQPATQTDSNGIASTNYDQVFVPPSESYSQATVTATTPVGAVNFKVTATAPFTNNSLTLDVYINKPGPLGTITGPSGSTMAGALQVSVAPVGVDCAVPVVFLDYGKVGCNERVSCPVEQACRQAVMLRDCKPFPVIIRWAL